MWKTRKQLSLGKMNIVGHGGRKVLLSVGLGHAIKTLKFLTEQDANGFVKLVTHLRSGRTERMERRKLAALNSIIIHDENASLDILVEIVSCWDLVGVDYDGRSDPYVRAEFEGREVHRTKYISNTRDPIYTIKTGSLFVLSTTLKKCFDAREGLKFTVKDYDTVGKNETLGIAIIPPRTIYDSNGERMVLPLIPEVGKSFAKGGNGFIAIRCRHATEQDLDFMRKLRHGIKSVGDTSPIALKSKGGKSAIKSLVAVNTKVEIDHTARDPKATVKKYKVRPYPDPARKSQTKWMTQAEIQEEAMKRSTSWIDAGSGGIGRVYLEIIGCDGLPNLDQTVGVLGNVKTDAFVCVVYEDCILKTDVIADSLSPRWMPWTKRAFMLRMMHSSSQVCLGVFDYNTAGQSDVVGRVCLDVSSYVPNTEFLMHFSLYNTDVMSKRKPRGTVTVRVMVEYEDERGLLTSALSFPRGHAFYVNMQQRSDFADVRYTATGKRGAEKYGLDQIIEYVDELFMCRRILFYAYEAAIAIIFWRGHAPITICVPRLCPCKDIEELGGKRCTRKLKILLPLRSLVVFIAAVHLVENPDDIPSFIWGTIAFIMLTTLHFRRNNPSKLMRCRTFHYYLRLLFFSKGFDRGLSIEPYDNAEEWELYEKQLEEKAAKFEEEAEAARLENLKKQEEYQKEMEEIGLANNVDISTNGGGISSGVSFDPFRAFYVQIQGILEQMITIIRFSRNVLVWEENFLAFWLTSTAIVLSFVCIFIPWRKVIEWSMRFLVWTFLGPWMKLVDIFWHSHFKHWLQQALEFQEKQEKEAMDLMKMEARTTKENVEKLKALKVAIFGKYISRVPVYKCGRYKDAPLPASEAHPFPASELKKEKASWNIARVHGQRLTGDMIPSIEDHVDSIVALEPSSSKADQDSVALERTDSNPAGENEPLLSSKEGEHHWYTIKSPLRREGGGG